MPKKIEINSKIFFWLAFATLFVFNIYTHFWGLERFNTLVFDETAYPKMAQAYLNGLPVNDPHPPLGKYLLALGLKISDKIGPLGVESNDLIGSIREPWMYRWISALAGLLTPFALGWLAWESSHRLRLTILAILFTSIEGLFLVESRYGLINIWLILFGVLGNAFFMKSLRSHGSKLSIFCLIFSGLFLGACISIKWTGIAFLVAPWTLWILLKLEKIFLMHHVTIAKKVDTVKFTLNFCYADCKAILSYEMEKCNRGIYEKLQSQSFSKLILCLLVIPAALYTLQWQPHLRINSISFIQAHQQTLNFHESMKEEHPYCSKWYTWPVMLRPVGYFFGTSKSINNSLPPNTPGSDKKGHDIFYDVHGMGNPPLWWCSIFALIGTAAYAILALKALLTAKFSISSSQKKSEIFSLKVKSLDQEQIFSIYLLIGYLGSLLPWAGISRCVFIYSYMPSLVFAILSLAYCSDYLLTLKRWRIISFAVILVSLMGFYYWLPIFLGLPLTSAEFFSRMWLLSWI